MTDLIPLAYHYGYGGGWTDWLGRVAIVAVIHALIYSLIFRVVHDLALGCFRLDKMPDLRYND